jgi:C4-dicarboxylate-specific signal transduction histidine kinase
MRAMLKHADPPFQDLALNEAVDEVFPLVRAELISRGVTVVSHLAPRLPPVRGDRVQIQQVILNLLLNGADAMAGNAPDARRLMITTRLVGERVRVSIRDEGCGLPPDCESLFKPFFTTKRHGLGLGLAICQSIIGVHQGQLWAEPHPERGAVFHFELDAATSPSSP